MPEPTRSSEIEKALKDAASVPEPEAEFLNSLRARFLAKGHANAKKNQEIQMRQKTFSQRMKWGLAVLGLVALVVLFTQPMVVNALKRLFGYVPNVGIIDQSSPVRMLTEPVTVTREGFTVTVEQAVLNGEMTAVVYSYSLPPDYVFPEDGKSTSLAPFLLLPDGTRLDILRARHVSSLDCPECYLRYLMEFSPIPASISEVIIEIPDLTALAGNTAPRDWKIPLKFEPADPSDIAPIIEQVVTPMPAGAGNDRPTRTIDTYGITQSLDKFATLPDGYILYGNTSWTDPSIPPYGVAAELAVIRDAAGMEVLSDYVDPERYAEMGEQRVYWAYKIGKDFTPPLTLSFALLVTLPADGGSFTFDPGPDPRLNQSWDIHQDVVVNDELIHVLTAEQGGIAPGFFLFTMQSDSNIVGASVTDLDHPPLGGGGGGGGIPAVGVPFHSGFGYQVPIPQGLLTLTFTHVQRLLPGEWTVTWGP